MSLTILLTFLCANGKQPTGRRDLSMVLTESKECARVFLRTMIYIFYAVYSKTVMMIY